MAVWTMERKATPFVCPAHPAPPGASSLVSELRFLVSEQYDVGRGACPAQCSETALDLLVGEDPLVRAIDAARNESRGAHSARTHSTPEGKGHTGGQRRIQDELVLGAREGRSLGVLRGKEHGDLVGRRRALH